MFKLTSDNDSSCGTVAHTVLYMDKKKRVTVPHLTVTVPHHTCKYMEALSLKCRYQI